MRGDLPFRVSRTRWYPAVRASLPTGFLILAGFILLWIYAYRISENPLVWEEPRRCLIAMEMIERRDCVVPHLLGETYWNKPPLQNWLLVLFSGNRLERVGPVPLRLISLLSLACISFLLWTLRRQEDSCLPSWAPALIFLTLGIVVQYGRSGEVDSLFAFWIVLAFWCYEQGRRIQSARLQWFLSQVFLAPAILTKVIAPVLFYPAVLYLGYRDRARFASCAPAVLAGLAAEILLVCAWLIPYSAASSVSSFFVHGWTEEILPRTPLGADVVAFLKHLALFPIECFVTLLPWSLACILLRSPRIRAAIVEAVQKKPLLRLSWTVSAWTLLLFWIMPGGKGRYLLPAYPFLAVLIAEVLGLQASAVRGTRGAARRTLRGFFQMAFVDRSTGWVYVILIWTGAVSLAGVSGATPHFTQPLVVGILALVASSYWIRRAGPGRLFQILLLLGFVYGIVYSGLTAVHRAETEERLLAPVQQIAEAVREPLPLICGKEVTRGASYVLARHLGRVPKRTPPSQGAYYLLTSLSEETNIHGNPVAQVPPLGLWRIGQD